MGPRRGVLTAVAAQTMLGLAGQAAALPPAFSNQTAGAGVTMTHVTSGFTNSDYAGGGAVGDFDRDGWQDLYVCKGGNGNAIDRLFINNGDGTFTDQAAAWGLTLAHKGKAAATGDYDGDGWVDLYVASAGPDGQAAQPGHNKLYRNNGDGTFTNVAAAAGVNFVNPAAQDSWAPAFGDYDLDGDLDLFVGGFTGAPSNAGNRLFRNNGDATFTDITAAIGLFSGVGPIACLSAAFVDTDADRYPELLLGGDFKGFGYVGSRYFRNNANGSFSDMTVASNTGVEENGMGQTRGDLNNDGRIDWYVTSIYGFPPNNWTGNKLYRNFGGHVYFEYAALAGADDGGYGWGALAVDFNHDGLVDLSETNGGNSAGGQFGGEQSYLFINAGGGNGFTEMAIASGLLHFGKGRSMLRLDYDNDGDQDVVITANNEPLNLYRNDLDLSDPGTHWLRVFLDTTGTDLAPEGIGAKVRTTAGGVQRTAWIDSGTSFAGTSERSAHFGLGTATVVDELQVTWPDGEVLVLTNVAVNQTITVSPPSLCAGDTNTDAVVDVVDLLALLGVWGPCPGPCPPACPGDFDDDCQVGVTDLLIMLGAWGPCP